MSRLSQSWRFCGTPPSGCSGRGCRLDPELGKWQTNENWHAAQSRLLKVVGPTELAQLEPDWATNSLDFELTHLYCHVCQPVCSANAQNQLVLLAMTTIQVQTNAQLCLLCNCTMYMAIVPKHSDEISIWCMDGLASPHAKSNTEATADFRAFRLMGNHTSVIFQTHRREPHLPLTSYHRVSLGRDLPACMQLHILGRRQ